MNPYSSFIPVLLPRGDIHKEVGSAPFAISCHLNPENKYYRDGYRSDRLGIYATDERNEQRQLKSRVVNSTTIEAVYNPAEIAEEFIKCKIDLPGDGYRGICTQIIFVGGELVNCFITVMWLGLHRNASLMPAGKKC